MDHGEKKTRGTISTKRPWTDMQVKLDMGTHSVEAEGRTVGTNSHPRCSILRVKSADKAAGNVADKAQIPAWGPAVVALRTLPFFNSTLFG